MNQAEKEEALERTRTMLRASYSGYKQFCNANGKDKQLGLYNAVTFGRSVTFVLQKQMGGKVDGFDEWYEEKREFLKQDPICSHMVEIRNKVLKEGEDGVENYAKIDGVSPADLQRKAPAWADNIFVGDQYGGSGFEVEMEDGSTKRFYYDFPDEKIEAGLFFEDLQESLEESGDLTSNAEDDLRYYVKVLGEVVQDVKKEFVETDESD